MWWRSATIALVGLGALPPLGCTKQPATGPSFAPPPTAEANDGPTEPATGELHFDINDPAADEGESWNIVVRPDGSFDLSHTWSDGADDTTDRCRGNLERSKVRRWFTHLRVAALPDPPPDPNWKGDGTDPDYFYDVSLVDNGQEPKYADPRRMQGRLDRWFAALREAAVDCG